MNKPATTTRVWDLPTRIFHWALVVLLAGQAISGTVGGDAMVWHFRFGYAVLTLLLFRLVWGVVGGRWSRFSAFVYGPASVINYLKGLGKPEHSVGHTPIGAVSVFALLALLLAQAGTGLLSDDEIAAAGPLTPWVSSATVSLATRYHASIGKWVLLALVVLHICAVLFYWWKKNENLIKPMWHGDKKLTVALPPSRDDTLSRMGALLVLGGCAGVVAWLVNLPAPVF